MPRTGGLLHSKLPQDAIIHTRQPEKPGTGDTERDVESFIQLGLERLAEQMGALARGIENRSFVVDEYVSGAGTTGAVTVQPTYEYMPEKIESILVTGPTGIITLTLGDRVLTLTIPASGILVIAPVAILLSRTDPRILTSQTPGVYFLELMGVANRRFQT